MFIIYLSVINNMLCAIIDYTYATKNQHKNTQKQYFLQHRTNDVICDVIYLIQYVNVTYYSAVNIIRFTIASLTGIS